MTAQKKKARRRVAKTSKKTSKKVSPMKGRKISQEKRGKDDPKLGRPYSYGAPTVKHVVTLSLPEGAMDAFLKKMKVPSQAKAITLLMSKIIKLPVAVPNKRKKKKD